MLILASGTDKDIRVLTFCPVCRYSYIDTPRHILIILMQIKVFLYHVKDSHISISISCQYSYIDFLLQSRTSIYCTIVFEATGLRARKVR